MRISRRTFLAAAPAILRGAQPPNFLFLLTDQQTHDALSCAGNRWLKTPAMDSLAARGTRYTTAYCPYPVCSPSRSSIFSGAMPGSHFCKPSLRHSTGFTRWPGGSRPR